MKQLLSIVAILCAVSAVQSQTGKIFCGEGYGVGIYVLDAITLDSLGYIPDAGGYRMAVSPDGSKIYSTSGGTDVYVTDAVNNQFVEQFNPSTDVSSTSELEGITLSPDGQTLYVFDESTSDLYAINTSDYSTQEVLGEIIFYEPENCVISPDGQTLFMVDNDYVHQISTNPLQLLNSYAVNSDVHGVAISVDGSKVYTEGSLGLYIFDALTLDTLATIPQVNGYFIESAKDGQKVYSTNEGNKLYVIDGNNDTLLDEITLSVGGARGVTTNISSDRVYVACGQGLIILDATNNTELGVYDGDFQSVLFYSTEIINVQEQGTPYALSLYPNPTKETLHITLDKEVGLIELMSLEGRKMKSFSNQNKSRLSINVSDLEAGVYLIRISGELGSTMQRFVVE